MNIGRLLETGELTRRQFLKLLSLGGAVAALTRCTGAPKPPGSQAGAAATSPSGTTAASETGATAVEGAGLFFKDPAPFVRHPGGVLESRLASQHGLITPNRLFFVRNNSDRATDIDATRWRLSVEGDGVESPRGFSYDEIRAMPSRSLICYLECAGNHRSMYDLVQGRQTLGTQWGTGAVGNAEWTGVALRHVLLAAGITADAVSVLLVGLDTEAPEGGFRRALPTRKALHPDTLLAYGMNGEDLPRDHGYPLRAVVPGWVGSSSIKWLGRIVVSKEQIWTRNNTTSYVLIGEHYPADPPAEGQPITTQVPNSALALPWPAELRAGFHVIRGYAHSPDGPIRRVQWSTDGGATWRDAVLTAPQPQYSWAQFAFDWEADPGEHTVMTRATDAAGNTQADAVPFNEKGYLFNQPLPHPIRIV